MADLKQCLKELGALYAGDDVYGKYLVCTVCYKVYRIPDTFTEKEWQDIYDVQNPPSVRELARRRVKAFLDARRAVIGEFGASEKLSEYPNEDGTAYERLLVSDLDLLVEEEKGNG